MGTVLLELVLLVLLVLAGFSQRSLSGTPIAVTVDPPPMGTCLRNAVDGVEAIPCSEPHLLQVTRSWSVLLWDGRGVNAGAAVEQCRLAATKFLGGAARFQGWGPIPLHTLSVLTGGPGNGDQPRGWQACGLMPQSDQGYPDADIRLSGSLSGATSMSARPALLRSCFDVAGPGWIPAPCSETHSGEFLAERLVPVTGGRLSPRSRNDLLASCHIAASWFIGRSLAGDDRVRITLRNGSIGPDDANPLTPTANSATSPPMITMRCAIEATAGHHLSSSVIGLGHQPVPLR